eukprot:gene170-4416_t
MNEEEKERKRILREIVETEKNYLKELEDFKKNYQLPISKGNYENFSKVFVNIESIIKINESLFKQLEANYNGVTKPSIGDIFIRFAPYLKLYTKYCKEYNTITSAFKQLKGENKKFRDLVSKLERSAIEDGRQPISSYLIMPVQRIPRYKMLLEELSKYTKKGQDENLIEAIEEIQSVGNFLNKTLREDEATTKIIQINRKLFYRPLDEDKKIQLITPTRKFIMEGQFMVIPDGGLENENDSTGWKYRTFYLFNDMILQCIYSGGDIILYDNILYLNTIPISWTRDLGMNDCFQIIGSNFTLTLQDSEKDKWIESIDRVISEIINNSNGNMKGKQRAIPSYTPNKYKDIVKRENNQIKQSQKITMNHYQYNKKDEIDLKEEKRKLLEEKRKLREEFSDDKNVLENKTKEINEKLQKLKLNSEKNDDELLKEDEKNNDKKNNDEQSDNEKNNDEIKKKEEKRRLLEEKRKLREEQKEEEKRKGIKEELKRQAEEELNKEEKENESIQIKERIEKEIPEIDKEKEKKGDELFAKGNLAFKQERDFENAIKLYSDAIEENNYLIQGYFNRGIVYYNLKEFKKSIKDMSTVIEYQPKNVRAIYIRGSCYKSLELYKNALDDFEECILLDSQSPHHILGLALCYDHLGDSIKAIESYTSFLFLDQSSVTALHNRGQNYYQLEKYEEAKEDYNNAIKLLSDDDDLDFKNELILNRSKCFIKLNQNEQTEISLDENISILREKAKNSFLSKNYKESIEYFSKIIEKENDKNELLLEYFNRGLSYKQINKINESINDFKKVIEIESDHLKSLIYISRLLKKINKFEESIQFYTKSIKLSPSNSDLYFERAMIYNQLKEYELAINDFSKSIEFEKDNVDSFYNRALIYHRQLKEYELAEKDYTMAIKLSNKNESDIFVDRALLYYIMEQDDKCKKDFEFALQLDPENERTKKILSKIKI